MWCTTSVRYVQLERRVIIGVWNLERRHSHGVTAASLRHGPEEQPSEHFMYDIRPGIPLLLHRLVHGLRPRPFPFLPRRCVLGSSVCLFFKFIILAFGIMAVCSTLLFLSLDVVDVDSRATSDGRAARRQLRAEVAPISGVQAS